MTDQLDIVINANTDRARASVNALLDAFKKASVELSKLEASFRSATGTSEKLANANKKTAQSTSALVRGFQGARTHLSNFRKEMHLGQTVVRSFSLAIVYSGYQLLQWAKNTGNVASDFLSFRNAIQIAAGSLEQATDQMQFAIGISKEFKIDITNTTKAYSKFVNAVKLAGAPLEDANQQFKVLAQVGRVLNLSQQSLSGMFLAIEQMASKGFVSLEELRRQLGEHLPGAVSIAAKAWSKYIGQQVTVGEFMKMVENRAVESTQFLKVFTKELDALTSPLLEQSLQKSSAAFVALSNSVTLLSANIGTFLQPAFVFFAESMTSIIDLLSSFFPVSDHLVAALNTQKQMYSSTAEETQKYAKEIDEIDSKLETLARATKVATDPTEQLKELFTGSGLALAGMTIAFGGSIKTLQVFGGALKTWVIAPLISTVSLLKRFAIIGALAVRLHPVTATLTAVGGALYYFRDSIASIFSASDKAANSIAKVKQEVKVLNDELQKDYMSAFLANYKKIGNLGDETGLSQLVGQLGLATAEVQANSLAVEVALQKYKDFVQANAALVQSSQTYQTIAKGYYDTFEQAGDILDSSRTRLLNIRDAINAVKESMDPAKQKFAELNYELDNEIAKLTMTEDAYLRNQYAIQGFTKAQINELMVKRARISAIEEEIEKEKELNSIKIGTITIPVTEQHQKYLDELNSKKVALEQSLMSEEELILQGYLRQDQMLDEWHQSNLEKEAEYLELKNALRNRYIDEQAQIEARGLSREAKMWESSWQGKMQFASNVLGGLSTLMLSENKKQFEIGKKMALAQAAIDTIVGAQKAFTSMLIPGNPASFALAIAAAAAATTAGIMRMQQISSTQFGGGSVSNVSGGSGGAIPSQEAPVLEQQETSAVTIQFIGDIYGLDDFKDTVVTTIQDAINEQDVIIIDSDSRQAQDLVVA